MKIPCYHKEMVALAARESRLNEEFISGINSDAVLQLKKLSPCLGREFF